MLRSVGSKLHFMWALSVCTLVLAGIMLPQGVNSAPARFDGVTLQISANYPEYAYAIRKFADEISQQYGIRMQFDTVTDPQAYPRDMLEFSGGRSSHDLVLFLSSALADYGRYLEPVVPLARANNVSLELGDDVMPVYRTYYTWANVALGIPFDCGGRFLAYNVAAFRRAENRTAFKAKFGYDLAPPQTWDEYRDVAEFFATSDWDGRGGTKLGSVEVWRRGLWVWVWWLDRFASYGGVYFDDQMHPLINSPAGMKALANMLAVKPYLSRNVATSTNPEMRAGFIRGDAPMFTTWGSTVELSQVPAVSKIVGNVGLALLPGVKDGQKIYHRPTFGSGYGLGIPKFSTHKDAAIQVLALLGDPKHHTAMTEDPQSLMKPCRVSSLKDPGYARKWTRYPGYARQYIELSLENAKIGLPDLQIPSGFEYITAADLQIQLAVTGQKNPKQALDDAAAEWNKITDRLGRADQLRFWTAQNTTLKKLGIRYRPELASAP